jgi:amphi-Trp domain-containing protein
MADLKFKKQEVVSRGQAAATLREIAAALDSGHDFELERSGEKLELDVPDMVTLELEVEIKEGETELELEIKWPPRSAAPADSVPE